MLDINIEKNKDLYTDYEAGLNFLKSLDQDYFSYPDEVTNFHVYTEVNNEKELACIESYFATQNIEKTKLIIWSDYDISNKECLQKYKHLIDFRIYNPIVESKDTILESNNLLLAKDKKYYLQSDLLRLLVLHKYGGIWIDMDIIFLKDFKPLLGDEWLYQWGSETDFISQGCCGTVMSLKKQSLLSKLFLEEILKSPISAETTVWGKDLFARVYKKHNFKILPSAFFNIEWLIGGHKLELCLKIQDCWFENPIDDEYLFDSCFAWHWHNSSNKNRTIVKGSKFDKLKNMIVKKIKN